MALSPSAPATSPLACQLLRHVTSGLVAAFHRPAPAISLPSAPRGVDVALAASHQRPRAASRPAPSPKGRPGAPRQGSGGQVHAAPAMATIASAVMPTNAVTTAATAHVVMRGPARPGLPAQGGGGKTHGAPAAAKARAAMQGPAPPGHPKEGSGGKVNAVSPAAMWSASVLMRGPAPPGHPAEGGGGRGGNIHAVAS